jgi:hypothetical protein
MTVVQNPGRLDIILALPDEKTRRESIANVRPTAADQDLYDIAVAISGLLNDPLSEIRLATSKVYAA